MQSLKRRGLAAIRSPVLCTMANFQGLYSELAGLVLDDLDVGDYENTGLFGELFPKVEQEVIEASCRKRLDIEAYMDTFIGCGRETLNLMLITETFLGGSRAADFFVKGVSTEQSDWDFYCTGDRDDIGFVTLWLISKGFTESEASVKANLDRGYEGIFPRGVFFTGTLVAKDGRPTVKVQLMGPRCTWPLNTILQYDITCIQAFISGLAAVHLHYPLTSKKKMFSVLDLSNPRYDVARIQKYKSRGFELVRHEDAVRSVHGPDPERSILAGGRYGTDSSARVVFTNPSLLGSAELSCARSEVCKELEGTFWIEGDNMLSVGSLMYGMLIAGPHTNHAIEENNREMSEFMLKFACKVYDVSIVSRDTERAIAVELDDDTLFLRAEISRSLNVPPSVSGRMGIVIASYIREWAEMCDYQAADLRRLFRS